MAVLYRRDQRWSPVFLCVVRVQTLNKESEAIQNTKAFRDAVTPETIRDLVLRSLDGDKAEDIDEIDLRGQSILADYIVVASGTSSRQVSALAEKLKIRLHAAGIEQVRIEGASEGNWVVVDAGDVIIHLFRPEVRAFYSLEKMWRMPQSVQTGL